MADCSKILTKIHLGLLFCPRHMRNASFFFWKRQVCGRQGELPSWSLAFPLQTFSSDTGFISVQTALAVPIHFNPDNDFLQVIRTVMQYWLQIGMIVFGVGLVKLVAYQAWSGMRQRGNTIDNITLNVGVINGSAYNAGKLLFLKRNRFLGGFFLVHFAIITAISLVVGFSISTLKNYKEHEVRIQLSHERNHFRHL